MKSEGILTYIDDGFLGIRQDVVDAGRESEQKFMKAPGGSKLGPRSLTVLGPAPSTSLVLSTQQ